MVRVSASRGVLFLDREVDTRTGTIQVRGEFPNPDNLLRPGQYARIRAMTETRRGASLVPAASVSELQGLYQVGVVGPDNKVTIKTVKLGPQVGDMWVVESGVQPGENVIVDGLQRVRTGVMVKPTPYKDTQANAVGAGTSYVKILHWSAHRCNCDRDHHGDWRRRCDVEVARRHASGHCAPADQRIDHVYRG